MSGTSIYDTHLDQSPANYAALSPITFLERAAATYPNRTSVIHGSKRFTWAETYARARRLASALSGLGVGKNDTVAVMAANTPEMYECAFGPAIAGAVVNTLNTRLDAAALAFSLNHGEAKVLITDTEFSISVKSALAELGRDITVIDIVDSESDINGETLGDAIARCGRVAENHLARKRADGRGVAVVIRRGAGAQDTLAAYTHGILLSDNDLRERNLAFTPAFWDEYSNSLVAAGWNLNASTLAPGAWRADW